MRPAVWISIFVTALVASNGWWAYHTLVHAIAADDRERYFSWHRGALVQTLAVSPVAARVNSTRDEVVEAARAAARFVSEPFEKDGFLWVGDIGLKFSDDGRLVEVVPAWGSP